MEEYVKSREIEQMLGERENYFFFTTKNIVILKSLFINEQSNIIKL